MPFLGMCIMQFLRRMRRSQENNLLHLDQRKILSLKEQGFSEIGVILADDTGRRVTVDKFGRVQWRCVDGSGVMEVCR